MAGYSIGEICEILALKPHVLRYWEQELPILNPRKSHSGRRIYSETDLHLLFRLRYLIYQKGYTLSGAGQRLLEDAMSTQLNKTGKIRQLRSQLLHIAAILNRQKQQFNSHTLTDED